MTRPTHHDDEPTGHPVIAVPAALLLGLLLAGSAARAATPTDDGLLPPGLSASFRAGTMGPGAEVEYHPAGAALGIRIGADGLGARLGDVFPRAVSVSQGPLSIDGRLAYDARVRLLTGHVVGDWHPLAALPGLRLSAGVVGNGNRLDTDLRPSGAVRVGPMTIPAATAVQGRGSATWNPVDPYVGIGYEAELGSGVSLSAEAGVFYQGHPHATAELSGPGASIPAVQALMQQERRRIASKVDYPFYPVVELSIGYRF